MKKVVREMQTLHAGPPKFNQLEMVTTCTYRPSLVKITMHAISSYRGNRHHPPTHYTVLQLASAQCNEQLQCCLQKHCHWNYDTVVSFVCQTG